jgi:lysozyme family protein
MSNFDRYIERILKHEGGYVNHPSDPGGATKYGITEAVARRHGFTEHMSRLPLAMAKDIYYKDYWLRIKGDSFAPSVAYHLLDAAVNHGVGNSIRWLQRVLGVADDGVIGPVTITAARSFAAVDVVLLFNAERLSFC